MYDPDHSGADGLLNPNGVWRRCNVEFHPLGEAANHEAVSGGPENQPPTQTPAK